MFDLQIFLTVLLIVIELIAFAWLIIDIRKSKKKQDQIIALENQILDVIVNLKKEKTIILISHDKNSLRYCDRIISLNNGYIDEINL